MRINEIFHESSKSSSVIWKSSPIMHLALPFSNPSGRGESRIYLSYGTSTAIFLPVFPKLIIISSPAWTRCSMWENFLFSSQTFRVSIKYPLDKLSTKLRLSHNIPRSPCCQVVKKPVGTGKETIKASFPISIFFCRFCKFIGAFWMISIESENFLCCSGRKGNTHSTCSSICWTDATIQRWQQYGSIISKGT